MIVAFDTSVIVAGVMTAHPHHRRAVVWLEAAVSGGLDARMCWHALGETWSVLTRLPVNPRIGGDEARQVLDRVRSHIRPIPLEEALYDAAIERCVARGVRSGAVFDALHLVAAERAGAELLLSFNLGDFERLAQPGLTRIAAPPDPPSIGLASGN